MLHGDDNEDHSKSKGRNNAEFSLKDALHASERPHHVDDKDFKPAHVFEVRAFPDHRDSRAGSRLGHTGTLVIHAREVCVVSGLPEGCSQRREGEITRWFQGIPRRITASCTFEGS